MKPAQAQLPKTKPEPTPAPTAVLPPPPPAWILDPTGWILDEHRRTLCMILPTVSKDVRTMIFEAPKVRRDRDRLLVALGELLGVSSFDGSAADNARALLAELTAKEPDGND